MTKESLSQKSKEELIEIILDIQKEHGYEVYEKLKSYESIHQKLMRVKSQNSKVCLILFKILNIEHTKELFNYTVMSKILENITKLLIKHIRRSDILVRFDQNQYLVIIPDTSVDSATLFAKKLNTLIYDNVFENLSHLRSNFCVSEFKDRDNVSTIINRLRKCLSKTEAKTTEDISTI